MNNYINNDIRSSVVRRDVVPESYGRSQHTNLYVKHHHGGRHCHPPKFNIALLDSLLRQIDQLLMQLGKQQPQHPQPPTPPSAPKDKYRSVDGSGNNQSNPKWGAAHEPLKRTLAPDPSREPGGSTEARLPSAREVSNTVSAQSGNTENRKGLSDMFWLWGQFLDHDITLVEGREGNEKADIAVPKGDPQFDPRGTGEAKLSFTRSDALTNAAGQKQHINEISALMDGSNVYGSDEETANSLRSFDGGKLKVSADNLLPKDDKGNFQAGDVRVNENAALTSMHTLWAREHNRIADQISERRPGLSDEKVYQKARQKVVAQMQAITYNEFLPNLLGEGALKPYSGYNPDKNPQVSQAFSTAAYRFGHTMLSSNLLRLDESGQEIPEGNLSLREAFFQPQRVSEAGIDPLLRGLASQTAQAVDPMIVDDVRNFLFGPPGAGGLDLASLNIQRGRDHGLPGYNDAREQMGMSRIESFDDPIWKDGVGEKLAQIYDSPDDVDLWVAGLAEKHTGDSLLGETNTHILKEQFENLRDGDSFWYENTYSGKALQRLNNLSLADIIRRNSDVSNIQDDVMVASNVHRGDAATEQQSEPAAVEKSAAAAQRTAPAAAATSDDGFVGRFLEGSFTATLPPDVVVTQSLTGQEDLVTLDMQVVDELIEAVAVGRLAF